MNKAKVLIQIQSLLDEFVAQNSDIVSGLVVGVTYRDTTMPNMLFAGRVNLTDSLIIEKYIADENMKLVCGQEQEQDEIEEHEVVEDPPITH